MHNSVKNCVISLSFLFRIGFELEQTFDNLPPFLNILQCRSYFNNWLPIFCISLTERFAAVCSHVNSLFCVTDTNMWRHLTAVMLRLKTCFRSFKDIYIWYFRRDLKLGQRIIFSLWLKPSREFCFELRAWACASLYTGQLLTKPMYP